MLWFFLSLLTAFFSATEAALIKRFLGDMTPWEVAGFPAVFSIPWFAAALVLLPAPSLGPDFWQTVVLLLPINALAYLLHMWAIQASPLSLTIPFMSFTPAFVIGTGFLFLGELPNTWGVVGILGVVAGGYVLNLGGESKGVWGPFRAVVRERGSLLILIAAGIWGVAAVMGKQMALQSSPIYAISVFFLIHNMLFAAGLVLFRKVRLRVFLTRPKEGAIVGTALFVHALCHFTAVVLVATAYMIAIKRLNGLFAVMYGGLLFKEENMRWRLAGALLMGAGAAVMALFG